MKKFDRRTFLCLAAACLSCPDSAKAFLPFGKGEKDINVFDPDSADIFGKILKDDAPDSLWKWHKEGFLYSKLSGDRVMCGVCPNRCLLSPGDRSVCRSKVNIKGRLYSLAYGNPCSINIDPIEKKPLYHFLPKSMAFSIATTGCSFRCLNCQNWEISQKKPEQVRHYDLFPDKVVESTLQSGAQSIAYTYSEATTYFEYMIDTARIAAKNKINNLWISNGSINSKPLLELCKVINAANVNIKSFDDDLYRKLNGGRLKPVLNTFKTLHEQQIHFEMTNLVVPGYVDKDEMVKKMCDWILTAIGPDHPLHFIRFFPRYKLNRLPPTPISTLTRFRKLAMEAGIRYVYAGNIPGHEGNHTSCHNCKKLLVKRFGYHIPEYNIKDGKCTFCNTLIPGKWDNSI
jgi:pyruvate formate lyase activating enzyme